MRKRGFSLIELAIVFVIIGLLISGILAAQSMIQTAKIQGVVRQLQQFDVSVTNFQTKYNQIPGDSNLFPNPLGDGGLTNDEKLDSWQENGAFWYQLSLGTDLKNSQGQNYPTFNPYAANVPGDCPQFNLNQNPAGIPCLWVRGPEDFGNGLVLHYAYDGSTAGILTGTIVRNMLRSIDAAAIDKKIDDGNGATGKVQNSAFTNYNLSDNSYSQEMFFEIGATSINLNK